MQETLFAILTNPQFRTTTSVEAILDQEFVSGASWFSKLPVLPVSTND